MSYVDEEMASQPDCWSLAGETASQQRELFPAAGERVAVVGCGTSWFMAQSYATLRESLGQGETDAFAASEAPLARDWDRVVAISRSGTTTEVVDLLSRTSSRSLAIVGVDDTPVTAAADDRIVLDFADERSVVQTRYATSVLALLRAHLGQDLTAAIADARAALAAEPPLDPARVEQVTFLGRGWTIGLAHEAALKMREAATFWTESYPAMEYRHGPISIAAPGRATWMFGTAPTGLAADVAATGATFVDDEIDPLADLVRAQRLAVALAARRGLDPDNPRHLTRSVILA